MDKHCNRRLPLDRFPVFLSILHRRDTKLLFEHILKITLAGIAQIRADLGKAPVAVGQKIASLVQFAFGNIVTYAHAKLRLEAAHQVRAGAVDLLSHIFDPNGGVGVAL